MQSLAKNSVYNIINKCQRMVFPLVSSVYVSRIILPEGVGKVSSAQNIVSYFVLIAALGIPVYGVKKIAQCGNDTQNRSKVFSELFIINSVSTVICSLVYLLIVLLFGYFHSKLTISLIAGILLFANFFSFEWFFQGLEKYKYLMSRSIIVSAFAVVSVFVFVKQKDDYINYALICTLYMVIPYIIDVFFLPQNVRFQLKNLKIENHLKPIFVLLASSVAIEVYVLTDVTMLSFLKGDAAVGYYTNAFKIIGVLRALIAAVCAVYLPQLSFLYGSGEKEKFIKLAKKGIGVLVTFAVPAAAGLILLSDSLIPILFGKAFAPSSLTAKILSLSVITVTVSNFTGYQILTVINKEKDVLLSTIIGATINIILNVILISRFSYNGAAIASVITEACVMAFQIVRIHNYKIDVFERKTVLSVIFSAIIMSVILVVINSFINSNAILLFIDTVVGITVYFIACCLTGNSALRELKNNITTENKND